VSRSEPRRVFRRLFFLSPARSSWVAPTAMDRGDE
jgi:hypothetical protein